MFCLFWFGVTVSAYGVEKSHTTRVDGHLIHTQNQALYRHVPCKTFLCVGELCRHIRSHDRLGTIARFSHTVFDLKYL